MSDTPRTDDVPHNVANLGVFARQLERELNAANERIRRLEEAGERMIQEPLRHRQRWILDQAKEAKP